MLVWNSWKKTAQIVCNRKECKNYTKLQIYQRSSMTIIWYEKVPQIFEDGNYIAARPLYIISKNIEAGSLLYHTKRNKMLNSNRVKSYWLFTLISQILWCMYIYCRLQYLLQLAMVCTKFLSIHSTLNSVQRSTICLTYMDGTVCIYRHFF